MKGMKKALCCLLATLTVLPITLTACNQEGNTDKTYTIQYTDDTGVHTIAVEKGKVYAMESIPERYGYEFLGLFDAQTGGKQFVNANGSAVFAYDLSKDSVLFPQWKAKEYTLILDYQGAPVIGDRQKTVTYGTSITELPTGLSLANHDFTGWYTAPNGEGTQVADHYGVLPQNALVTEDTFDLNDKNGRIHLYAGFSLWQHTLTLHFADSATETVQVSHGTHIKDIVYDTRVAGKGVLTWSTKENDTDKTSVFNTTVDKGLILYATEYAPVIELDTDGGKAVAPIVAKSGATVTLPTPEKENYKFIEWQDEDGNAYTGTTMPETGAKLKAKWQAKLVFDENGGTEVADVSETAGTTIELPVPEKEGYIFAGWYTADKEKYETTKMPATGIALKAGWYKAKMKVIGSGKKEGYSKYLSAQEEASQSADWREEFDLSDILPASGGNIHVKWIYEARIEYGKGGRMLFSAYYYDQAIVGNSYVLAHATAEVSTTAKREIVFESNVAMKSNTLYIAYGAKNIGTSRDRVYFKRVSAEITYPDTTTLYL